MDDKDAKVRDRAYAIWQEEGEPHGRDAEHWHRAAGEVDASGQPLPEADTPASAPSPTAAKAKKPGLSR